MQALKQTHPKEVQKPVTRDRNTAEELDIELTDVSESGFSVRLRRTVFEAEAEENSEGKRLIFDQAEEVEEFSVNFVEENYSGFLPGPWELVQEETVEPVEVETIPKTVPELPGKKESGRVPAPMQDVEPVSGGDVTSYASPPTSDTEPLDNGSKGYTEEYFEEDDGRPSTFSSPPGASWENLEYEREVTGRDRGMVGVYSLGEALQDRTVSGEEAVREMLEETRIEGTVEKVEGYGLTEDFEGESPEAYWVDIEGMDMEKTEYFINGELAEDSVNHYELEAGDEIAFVESDVFEGEEEYCTGQLFMEDLDLEEADVVSYTVDGAAGEPGQASYPAAV